MDASILASMNAPRPMRGLWLEEKTLTRREDISRPEPPQGEALIRVLTVGVCNTDLELVRGYYPYTGIPGHEFVGVVQEGPAELKGRRVVGEINAVCGRCPSCREDRRSHCPRRTVLGIVNRPGAFAEYLTLPAENLHPVPDGVETDVAVFTEPLAAALQIREQVEITSDHKVLVVGDGKLGQLIARSLLLTRCDLTVAGKHEGKLDLLGALGIRTVYPDSVTDASFDVAVECTGDPSGFAGALKAVRPRGTLVMKSTYAGELTVDAAAVVVNEIRLVGSRCGPFAPALKLLAGGKVDVAPLITARFPLSDGVAAFHKAAEPGTLKVLVDVSTD